ncbi:MAG TPA: elongation factor Ts [Candidatus Paceibacterota bacterium]|nr:elongation factor Ts [Candidatus Paceibacterota bacterium]
MITTEQIKSLREKTGVSVMQCKKALEEAKGDEEKALLFLRKKSGEIAAKKSDREFGAGKIASYIHAGGTVGVLVELVSETDFVANNEEFGTLAREIALHIAAMNPEAVDRDGISEEKKEKILEVINEESADQVKGKPEDVQKKIIDGKMDAYYKEKVLLEQPFVKNPDITIREFIESSVQKFGERIAVARFTRYNVLG